MPKKEPFKHQISWLAVNKHCRNKKAETKMIVRPSTEMCFEKKYSIVSQLNCRSTFQKKKKKPLSTHSVCSLTFKSSIELLKHDVHQTEQLLERKEKSGIAKPSTHFHYVVFQKKRSTRTAQLESDAWPHLWKCRLQTRVCVLWKFFRWMLIVHRLWEK